MLWNQNLPKQEQQKFNQTAYALKTPHVVFPPVELLLWQVHRIGSQKSMEHPNEHFFTS